MGAPSGTNDAFPDDHLTKVGFSGSRSKVCSGNAVHRITHSHLTVGFKSHGMYIDKPLQKHTLIQAISRVNRVFDGKDKGLVVDYNMELTVLLYQNGYPPEWDEEVFEKVMEQAENFKKYSDR